MAKHKRSKAAATISQYIKILKKHGVTLNGTHDPNGYLYHTFRIQDKNGLGHARNTLRNDTHVLIQNGWHTHSEPQSYELGGSTKVGYACQTLFHYSQPQSQPLNQQFTITAEGTLKDQ